MAMMSPMAAAYGMPAMMPGVMPQQMMMPGAMPYGMYGQPPGAYNPMMSMVPPGAMVSQGMLAQALGVPGAQMMQEQPSTISRVLKGAGLGAAAGAAFGIIPFLPLGLFSGAIVGAGVGAVIALLKKPKPPEFHTMSPEQQMAQAQAEMVASTPPGARSAAATTGEIPERKPVVMGPEMRRKWAARVRAEKAAAAKAAAAKS